jgi:polyhydroxybutyrate depolymerase
MLKGFLFKAVCIAFFAVSGSGIAQAETFEFGGEQRSYEIDQAIGESRGLILALHGGGGSAKRFRKSSGIKDVAVNAGFTVVWPDSDGGRWNDGRLNTEGDIINAIDDEGYLLALIDHVVKTENIKPGKVFITGHSNGGMMSFYMGCKHPKLFKGIAPVSANVPRPMDCAGKGPIPMLNLVGLQDRVVPFEGGGIFGRLRRGALMSVEQGFETLATRNQCKANETENGQDVIRVTGKACKAATVQLRIKEQGHRFPETAAKAIVNFFSKL